MKKKLLYICGLQLYALLIAYWHSLSGIVTDEAKYLLNIPYPHPPLARYLIGLTDGFVYQEIIWRVLFATIVVQCVWLIENKKQETRNKKQPCYALNNITSVAPLLYVCSAPILLQAGTVMMAPLTAMQAMLLLWMMRKDMSAPLIGLVWLASLFTAYQAILFAPIVLFGVWKKNLPLWQKASVFVVPIALLALYTPTNPLALSSFVTHGSRDLGSTIIDRGHETLRLWAIGGSVMVSVLGTFWMVKLRRWDLILSLLLVTTYIALSRYDYYAILFLPLFVAALSDKRTVIGNPHVKLLMTWVITIAIVVGYQPSTEMSMSRRISREISSHGITEGYLLVAGSFGHDWQYESPIPVRRFAPHLLENAMAVACPTGCNEIATDLSVWNRIYIEKGEFYIK